MNRLLHNNATRRPALSSARAINICVVDPQADFYGKWKKTAESTGVQVHVVATAEQALRLARTTTVDLWVINAHLPGISGCELCRMLKSQAPQAPIWLVADDYSVDVERAALANRATLFCCKAMLAEHFEALLGRDSMRCPPPRAAAPLGHKQ